jgi:uncharacterized protein
MSTKTLRASLLKIIEKKITKDDVSHDINHVLRVLKMVERIAASERADLEIVIPAALFHDIIVYPKYDPRSRRETDESAEFAGRILKKIKGFPRGKVEKVKTAIRQCSFRKGITPDFLEAKILQDADRLEATGAVSVMRTFSSAGQWKRTFYHPTDPFWKKRNPDAHKYSLDLFPVRLLRVKNFMHTKLAKAIAERRTRFLEKFLKEFELELKEINKK